MVALSLLAFMIMSLSLARDAEGIWCYDCIFGEQKQCNDPFSADNISRVNCNGVCMKAKNTGTGEVTRQCLGEHHNVRCTEEKVGVDSINVCFCTKDLCNDVTGNHVTTWTTFALGVLATVWLKINEWM